MYYKRFLEKKVIKSLEHYPVTTILVPRQCGKSTLAKHLLQNYEQTIYLDLERPSDLQKIDDAECKASLSPKLSKGNYISQADVKSDKLLVVIPSDDAYEKNKTTHIASLNHAMSFVKAYFDM